MDEPLFQVRSQHHKPIKSRVGFMTGTVSDEIVVLFDDNAPLSYSTINYKYK